MNNHGNSPAYFALILPFSLIVNELLDAIVAFAQFILDGLPLLGGNGRYLYLRDNTDGQFWSPSWQPTLTALHQQVLHRPRQVLIGTMHCADAPWVSLEDQRREALWPTPDPYG